MQHFDPSVSDGTVNSCTSQLCVTAWRGSDSGSETGVSAEDRVITFTHSSCQVLP